MKMSYMGIKQHCLTLERDGYLDTWRRPQKMGRPEMVYRLTRRTHDLFPRKQPINSRTLAVDQGNLRTQWSGEIAFQVFERKADAFKSKVKGDTVAERAKWLARIRENEGFMSQFITAEREGGPQILECHSPLMNLLEQYPIIGRLEGDLFEAFSAPKFAAKNRAPRDLRVRVLFCLDLRPSRR